MGICPAVNEVLELLRSGGDNESAELIKDER